MFHFFSFLWILEENITVIADASFNPKSQSYNLVGEHPATGLISLMI
jgi:hypothetical protein